MDDRIGRIKPKARVTAKRAKMVIAPTGKISTSTRAGIVFPVGRIRRHIKHSMPGLRIGKGSAVYMAAVLEYLSA